MPAQGARRSRARRPPADTCRASRFSALPKDIPDAIIALVGDLTVGQTFHVREITPPQGVKILTDPELIVATLTAHSRRGGRSAAAPVEGEGGVEPEVIGRQGPRTGEEEEEGDDKKKK